MSLKPSSVRCLADENLNLKVVRPLSKLGYDVMLAPKGIKNGELIKLAIKDSRIFITHDQDFLDSKRYPPKKTAGMVVITIHPQIESIVLSSLKKFLETIDLDTLQGCLVILEKNGYTIGNREILF